MDKLKLKITVIALLVLESLLMLKTFFLLKDYFLDIDNSPFSPQDKMFLFTSFLVLAIISTIFVILIFIYSGKKEIVEIKVPAETKQDASKERRRKNEEEQRRLSEIEKKRNKTINSLMNGLNTKLNLPEYSEKLLSNLAKQYELVQGIVFIQNDKGIFKKEGAYAFYREDEAPEFTEGVGIAGQVATNKELVNISNLPEKYLKVLSGLGSSSPANLVIFPILYENKSIGIVELATFVKMDKLAEQVIKVFSRRLGEHLGEIQNQMTKTPETTN